MFYQNLNDDQKKDFEIFFEVDISAEKILEICPVLEAFYSITDFEYTKKHIIPYTPSVLQVDCFNVKREFEYFSEFLVKYYPLNEFKKYIRNDFVENTSITFTDKKHGLYNFNYTPLEQNASDFIILKNIIRFNNIEKLKWFIEIVKDRLFKKSKYVMLKYQYIIFIYCILYYSDMSDKIINIMNKNKINLYNYRQFMNGTLYISDFNKLKQHIENEDNILYEVNRNILFYRKFWNNNICQRISLLEKYLEISNNYLFILYVCPYILSLNDTDFLSDDDAIDLYNKLLHKLYITNCNYNVLKLIIKNLNNILSEIDKYKKDKLKTIVIKYLHNMIIKMKQLKTDK